MSVELHVFLQEAQFPTLEQWQRGLHGAGFDLVLDQSVSLREHSGFLPATYKGEETGFEFDVSAATEIAPTYASVAPRLAGRDLSANFRFGGDTNEMLAAITASAVLTKLTDGIFYDPQDDSFADGEEAIALATRTAEETV